MDATSVKKVVVIGGGTGSYTVLSGLKKFPLNPISIVSMMDSGGSSGRLRDEFGTLPPGDIRQSLVALSSSTSTLRKLFSYRFEKGEGLVGHNFGNLFLTALADLYGDMGKAIERAGKILNIQGQVYPVTNDNVQLVAQYEDGQIVKGERFIDEPDVEKEIFISKIWLEPEASIYPEAEEALKAADLIILGPGDLYTSTIPNLVVNGVSDAIKDSNAKKVYIVNLMSKLGQTRGLTASDCASEVEKYLGGPIDFILINNSDLPKDILEKYAEEKDFPIKDDFEKDSRIIRNDFVASGEVIVSKSDTLKRSLIRHDGNKLAETLVSLL